MIHVRHFSSLFSTYAIPFFLFSLLVNEWVGWFFFLWLHFWWLSAYFLTKEICLPETDTDLGAKILGWKCLWNGNHSSSGSSSVSKWSSGRFLVSRWKRLAFNRQLQNMTSLMRCFRKKKWPLRSHIFKICKIIFWNSSLNFWMEEAVYFKNKIIFAAERKKRTLGKKIYNNFLGPQWKYVRLTAHVQYAQGTPTFEGT